MLLPVVLTADLIVILSRNAQGLVTILLSVRLVDTTSLIVNKILVHAIQLGIIRVLQLESMMVYDQVLLMLKHAPSGSQGNVSDYCMLIKESSLAYI